MDEGRREEWNLGRILAEFDKGLSSEEGAKVAASSFAEFEKAGDQFGSYVLIDRLGEGGFGVVWEAVQSAPLKRRVAIKILKPGLDSKEVLARFDQERQALARMSHPNIAKVLDAGVTKAGRSYFVMELARGLPITQFVEAEAMSLRERLAIFQTVCRAVGHAHQNGIMHRDLKPSNILVAGGIPPEVTIIDFGIAKAVGCEPFSDLTIVTLDNRLIGTPRYMSPEQIRADANIDTRSDVYSLGVLLYELLTGENPLERSGIESCGFPEKIRLIAERPTPTPIQVWRQMDGAGRKRRTESLQLEERDVRRLLRGDLSKIVMKSMEKSPARRYDTTQELAADIGRFLEHRPVLAHPPSTAYAMLRYARRHRAAIVAAGGILAAIVAGLIVSLSLYHREKKARAVAVVEADRSRQVTALLADALASAGVSKSLGRDATMMREVLDTTAERLEAEENLSPEVEVQLRRIIGTTYRDVDRYEDATQQLRRALDLVRWLHKEDHADTAMVLLRYAEALELAGQRREAEPFAREALAMRKRLFGEESDEAGEAEEQLAWILVKSGRIEEAAPHAERAFGRWLLDPNDLRFEEAPKTHATVYKRRGKFDRAVEIFHQELEHLKKQFGPEHPNIANCLDNLGAALVAAGRFDEAEPILEEGLEQGRRFFGDRCPHEDHILTHLSRIARHRGEFAKELRLCQEAVAVSRRVYPKYHPYRVEPETHLLKVLFDQARALMDATDPPYAGLPASERQSLIEARLEELWRLRDEGELSVALDVGVLEALGSDLRRRKFESEF